MKIMIIASWYPTPDSPLDGVFFQNRARALAAQGCEVSVATADIRVRLGSRKTGISVNCEQGVTEYRYTKRNVTPFWEEGIALQQIAMIYSIYERICRDSGKPDLIHLESARCAYAAAALAEKEQIPLTYSEHYSGILNSKPGSFLYRSMRRAVEAATHVFAISSAMKNKLSPAEGKWSYLPNAVDFSQFSLTCPRMPFTFCAMGGLRKIKGYDLLLRSFAQVHEEYPECRLVIGGDGEEKAALTALCEELSLTQYVRFCGSIPAQQRNAFFSGASAFVCSSHTETFSIVTLEALACGIPVVATKCGGPEDLVDETNGYLVEKNDTDALAEGMKRMLLNRHTFSSENIRQQALMRYSEEEIVKKQLAQYSAVISQ